MDRDCSETGEKFTFSCFKYDDDGPYLDMEFYGTSSPLEENNNGDSKEFEFSISPVCDRNNTPQHGISELTDGVSPADDLFYKGQLLPLHLPPRLQMVRNLSICRESGDDKNMSSGKAVNFQSRNEGFDFDTLFSSRSEDSNQIPVGSKQVEFSSPKTDKTAKNSIMKSVIKLKVSLFGFRKSSKVGMDYHCSNRCSQPPPPTTKYPRFAIKLNSMKTCVLFFVRNYSLSPKPQKSPDCLSRSSSAKRVIEKYLRMVKHKTTERHEDISVDDHQLHVKDECTCIAGESKRVANISFSGNLKMGIKHFEGIGSCPPSLNSSPHHNGVLTNFYGDDLQSAIEGAIAHCKQSIGSRTTGENSKPLFWYVYD